MFKKSLILFSLSLVSIFSNAQNEKLKNSNAQKFDEILTYINSLYVDTVNDTQLTDAAITSMLEKLDPHSVYIPKEEVDDANEKINGSFVGIGIKFQILKDTLVVVQTIPGGPSEKIGIKAGDRILTIEGKSVAGIGLKNTQVREKLMGEMGTKVKIEVQRKLVKKNLDFVITRDNIPVHSVDAAYMINENTGYIKLNAFGRTTTEEIQKSLKDLTKLGMKNLIFDLQDNGGGLLYAAKTVSDEFLSQDKLIVYSIGRSQPRQDLKAGALGNWEKGRLVILTNENTASASEIVSGAIQDWDRGLIIGRRSYGKGLVQRPIDLTDGSQIRLTIARYFTPSGRFIQKPYDDLEAYRNDYMDRYLHGELSSQDSVKFNDSLKFVTNISKRTVYGGGGIMPDVFVPIDTTGYTEFYKSILRAGHFSSFALTYVEKNRDKLANNYPSFEKYKSDFVVDKKLMDEFFEFIKKEDKEFKQNEEQYKDSEKSMKMRMKAVLAQDLWGISEYYQIANAENEILQKAIETIESEKYETYGLTK
ncbi:MAG: S41 family peptidase [Flavobacteriia bacterium]|jgi:carboxyl-terminal processing protease